MTCKVIGCGLEKCEHRLTGVSCPICGMPLVSVISTGFVFCSNRSMVCDYELYPPVCITDDDTEKSK